MMFVYVLIICIFLVVVVPARDHPEGDEQLNGINGGVSETSQVSSETDSEFLDDSLPESPVVTSTPTVSIYPKLSYNEDEGDEEDPGI